jgi:translocator protein
MAMRQRDWLTLGGVGLASAAVSILGGLATATSVRTWYQSLAKPGFTPPDAAFAPAWTALYIAMAIAAWLAWRQGARLLPYWLQLALNLAWSVLFFGLRRPDLALIELAALWLAILWTIVVFWRASMPAGLLMLPYLAWVSFAGALNFEVWRLN